MVLSHYFTDFFFQNTKVIYCDRGDPIEGIRLLPIKNRITCFLRLVELLTISFLERAICLKSDKIIFNSRWRLRKVEKLVGKRLTNAQVIPNNANPSWVRKWLSEITEFSTIDIDMSWNNKKVIGFVGNLYEVGNGLDILLTAFKIISERIPESVLVIVGDGPDKRKLKQKAGKMNLDNRVCFTGGVPNPFLYMTKFDVFVHPARHHSCPNAILESLICNIPVIGSRAGGIPEILKYDELLFELGNAKELADKIVHFFTDAIYREKIKKLTSQLKDEYLFDWQEAMCSAIKDTVINAK